MKKLEAVIKPSKLSDVQNALKSFGINGMTVFEVKGFGNQKGHTQIYRGVEYPGDFLPKIRIDVYVPDSKVDGAIAAIISSAKTGDIGDGKIIVTNIDDAIRIRTEERGDLAL